FEMLPLVFSCGLDGLATAASTTTGTLGAGSPMFQWFYNPLMKALNNPLSFTLEKADDVVNYQCDYGMFERINIKGTINQGGEVSAVTVTGDFFAREWASTGAAAIAPIDVFPINAKLATLDIDALWANLGTTPMTATLRAFDIDIITGLHPKMLGDTTKVFAKHGEGIIDVVSAFTFEGNALASTEYGNFLTQTDRAYRLTLDNPATTIPYGRSSRLMIDVFGRWKEVIPFADEDRGNNLFTLVHQSLLDPLDYAGTPDMLEVTVNTT
ncbi:unnamed protein product, partial [marine sediment metagenome]